MEIAAIKEKLSIDQVLRHYGISIGKNNHINCPFHEDKTPSMRVYQETGTVYCFSGNCKTHGKSLDAIDFIMKKEACTKHEALVKAKAFLGYVKPTKASDSLSLTKVFKSFQNGLEQTKKAKTYAKTRGLEHGQIGYNSGQLHHRKSEDFIQSLVKLSLLTITKNSRRVWAKGCLVFPLLDTSGKVVSLYGRKIEGGGHYYLSGRSGLYPSYLAAATEKVILTESIIDAATLLQLPKIVENYHVLALYGTNGLTTEHQNHLKSLKNLKEVVLMLDGDEAGRAASKKHQDALKILLPTVNIRIVELPENTDINELWVNHLSEELFLELLKIPESIKTVKAASNVLNIDNPNNILYVGKYATYAIKGGIKSKHLDCLKITLVTANEHGRKYRAKVDLYEDTGVNKYLKAASEKLGLRDDLLDLDIALLTDHLEQYREENTLSLSTEKEKTFSISGVEKSAALQFLKAANLLEKLNQKIGKSGIVGEENNRLLLLIVASSYKQENPLHALIQGSSGSGKTLLLRKIMHFLPDPIRHIWTRITDKSLYHAGSKYKHHAIAVEDWDGISEDTQYVIR
ncbi:MAG: toprim domain-containing protein, partial [Aureispira sp.]|nr:toprim domain-containing protein [Aureispira sp.]